MSDLIGDEIGGSGKPSRKVTILLGAALVLVLIGIGVWAAMPRGPQLSVRPTGVPWTEQDGITFVVLQLNLTEREVIASLELPRHRFEASLFALERECRFWVTYGGMEYPAVTIMVNRIPLPEGSRVDRLVLTGVLNKQHPLPDPATQTIKAGIQIPGELLKRRDALRLIVEGVEKVTR